MKKIIFPIIFIVIVCSIAIAYLFKQKNINEYYPSSNIGELSLPVSAATTNIIDNTATATPTIETLVSDETISIPEQKTISVPFADQAPLKNWDDPYQEACEETSIIMAKVYLDGNNAEDLDKTYINEQILALVDYQEKNWGGHHDLDTKLTLKLLQDFYGINGQIVSINSADDLKKLIAQDKIIIAPTYGKKLNNPYFTAPGPVYHMLLIKGYNNTDFITNDPGVWQGKNFTYSFDNLFAAIADLPAEAAGQKGYIKTHEELMNSAFKNIIVISQQ